MTWSHEQALLLILLGLLAVFTILVDGFLDWFNLLERSRYWVPVGMIAVPMTFVIATGGIDLSVGAILATAGIVLGLLYRDAGWPIAMAALGAVGVATRAGAVNGLVSSYLRVPPLVVTLATMTLFGGLATGLSQARPIGDFPSSFQWWGQGNFLEFETGLTGTVFLPVPILLLAGVTLIGGLLIRHSWVGRFTESIGENPVAARFAGVRVRRLKLALYAASGLTAGLATICYTALYATARADAGRGMELEAIASVVLGGTPIRGGRGSVTGSLIGVLILGILRYGLEMGGVASEHLIIFVGGLLIATAVLNEWLASGRRRAT